MRPASFELLVGCLIALCILAHFWQPSFVTRRRLQRQIRWLRLEAEHVRLIYNEECAAESTVTFHDDLPCTAKALAATPHDLWYNASIAHVGGFEPYSALVRAANIESRLQFHTHLPSPGVVWDVDKQFEVLTRLTAAATAATPNPSAPRGLGLPFSPVDWALLAAFIAQSGAARVIEMGHRCLPDEFVAAALKGGSPRYVLVDAAAPQARLDIVRSVGGEVVSRAPATAYTAVAEMAQAGDVVVACSTHVVRADSESLTNVMFLVPSLRSGVRVVFPDVWLPEHYHPTFFTKRHLLVTEQYMLHALLCHSASRYEITLAAHLLATLPNATAALAAAVGEKTTALQREAEAADPLASPTLMVVSVR